jgi:hypothetical protein
MKKDKQYYVSLIGTQLEIKTEEQELQLKNRNKVIKTFYRKVSEDCAEKYHLKDCRVILPNTAHTRDYKPSRINVVVSENGIIEEVWCG